MKTRKNAGFTLIEMLGAVTLIAIVGALVFVNVVAYQRSMALLELDATAKEVYIAAQNHLTMAKNMGLLEQESDSSNKYAIGTLDETSENADKDIYYFTYPSDTLSDDEDSPLSILDLMLPPFSIDESVRSGNSYVISYQRSTALVVDVFYAKTTGQFAHTFVSDEYSNLLNYKGDADRTEYTYNGNSAIIGWYGSDASDIEVGNELTAPTIEVHNEEKLWVEVTNTNMVGNDSTACLKLVVTGAESKARKTFDLIVSSDGETYTLPQSLMTEGQTSKETFYYVFDDITTGSKHFSEVFASADTTSSAFIPGENLKVQAIAYDNNKLTNVAKTSTKTVNSLYATIQSGDTTTTARIRNFRHLENLDTNISLVDESDLALATASQIANMRWDKFCSAVHSINEETGATDPTSIQIYKSGSSIAATTSNTYYPIDPSYVLAYDGQDHTIANVKVNTSSAAGLFGTISEEDSSIANLKLVDFHIVSSGDTAGALVGTISSSSAVSNVIAYNSGSSITQDASAVEGVTAAGGLIGSTTSCTITECAAAMYVTSTGSSAAAGGLVGTTSGGSITKSYAAGHLTESSVSSSADDPKAVTYSTTAGNVTASGTSGVAGGLVGTTSSTGITYCYSTCSAFGAGTAGGLVGTISGSSVTNSYATGLVGSATGTSDISGVTLGAFVGTNSSATFSNDTYLAIINETNSVYAVSTDTDSSTTTGISMADADTSSYKTFCSLTNDATPYASTLEDYYEGKYTFKTADELASVTDGTTASATHYGDWPTPETLVLNTKSATSVAYQLVPSTTDDLYVGTTGVTLTLQVSKNGGEYEDYDGEVTWTSSDESIVNVSGTTQVANLTLAAKGEATITAFINGTEVASSTVTVLQNTTSAPTLGEVSHSNGYLATKELSGVTSAGGVNDVRWVEKVDVNGITYMALEFAYRKGEYYGIYALIYYDGTYYKAKSASGGDTYCTMGIGDSWYTPFDVSYLSSTTQYRDSRGGGLFYWEEVEPYTGVLTDNKTPGTRAFATDTSSEYYVGDDTISTSLKYVKENVEWEPFRDYCMVAVYHSGGPETVGAVWYNGNYYVPRSNGQDVNVEILQTGFLNTHLTDNKEHTYAGVANTHTVVWEKIDDPYATN